MPRGYRLFIAALVGLAIVVSIGLGWLLQPEKPNLSGDGGYGEQEASYQARSADCQPASLNRLSRNKRVNKAEACAKYEEEHREAANSVIEARRSADAANASAIIAYKQTRIAAWGFSAGVVTLLAAIAAAGFAGIAAYHTSRSADEAAKSHKTFIESERGRIEVARVAYEHGRLVLKIKNIGGSVAIITGVLGEVDSNWMDDPSGPLGHYQLKLANDGRASLPVLVVLPDMPVRSVVGFISYRTLGVPDCRTHFSCTIERSGGVPTIELANPIWQPDDT